MKTLIVKSKNQSNWKSCVTITDGLTRLYSNMPQIDIDRLNHESYFSNIEELKTKIIEEDIQKLVFIDHDPTAPRVINDLIKIKGHLNIKQIAIHVFGDFTYFAEEWLIFLKQVSGFDLKLYVASTAQKKLLEVFISGISIDIVPFLIPERIKFDEDKRLSSRKALNINSNEIVFLYTGRISLQKNSLPLLIEFDKFSKVNQDVRLILAGEFDDRGFSYLNVNLPLGHMHTKILEHQLFSNDKINFVGSLDQDQIEKYYLAADAFVSLSTYHDEDFGMSALEALGYGLPVILSDWGGYHDFLSKVKNENERFAYPINIKLDNELHFNTKDLLNAFKDIVKNTSYLFSERKHISTYFCKSYSYPNIKVKDDLDFTEQKLKVNESLDLLVSSQNKAIRNKELNNSLLPDSELYQLIYSQYTFTSSHSDLKKLDYLEHILEASYSRNQFEMFGKKLLPFGQCFTPFRDYYFSIIPAIFLSNVETSSDLNKKNEWIVRDGSVLILDFFKRCEPLDYNLIIPKKFASLVPKNWMKHVLFYDYSFEFTNESNKKILATMPKESFSKMSNFAKKINKLIKKEDQVKAFFPIRKKDFFVKEKTERYFDYAKELWTKNSNVEFIDWHNAQSLEGMQYIEINDHRYVFDSYPLHYFASKKCSIYFDVIPENKNNSFKFIKSVPLSLYHSLIIESIDFDLYEIDQKLINETEVELSQYRKNLENYNPIFEQ